MPVRFVGGGPGRRLPSPGEGAHAPPERLLRLSFDLASEPSDNGYGSGHPAYLPTVVTRDAGDGAAAGAVAATLARRLPPSAMRAATPVPRQALTVAPLMTVSCERDSTSSVVPPPPPAPRVDIAGLSLAGYAPGGYKDSNQDAALLLDSFLSNRQQLAAVMDGHGPEGHRVSAFVRQNLPFTLLRHLMAGTADPDGGGGSGGDEEAAGLERQRGEASSRPPGADSAARPSARGPAAGSAGGGGDGSEPLHLALRRAVACLDDHLARSGIDVINSGTTVAMCHVHGRKLTAAWVGDSRLVLGLPAASPGATTGRRSGTGTAAGGGGGEGGGGSSGWRVAWSSTDHKPEAPDEVARIEAAGGRVARSVGLSGPTGPFRVWFKHEDYPGLAMSRALGDLPGRQIGITASPSLASLQLPANNSAAVLVLASDGVWELLDNQEVVDVAAGAGSAAEAASRLVQRSRHAWVKEYGGSYIDDITALVVRFNMPPAEGGPQAGGG